MPINIEKMGAAIGQALLYSVAYKEKYPSQKWNVMPAVCTWSLGSGSAYVILLCKRLGVTLINLDTQDYVAQYTKPQALKSTTSMTIIQGFSSCLYLLVACYVKSHITSKSIHERNDSGMNNPIIINKPT